MGLFDKKFCGICGDKVNLISGYRKLSDGWICNECTERLSPFFAILKDATVEEIKEQLKYRADNKTALRTFKPMVIIDGDNENIYVDTEKQTFVVSKSKPGNWSQENPDLIPISAITSLLLDITERKTEVFCTDAQGKKQSYNPKQFKNEYSFILRFVVDMPYFDSFSVTLNEYPVEGMGSVEYNRYSQIAQQAMNALGIDVMTASHGVGLNPGMTVGYSRAEDAQPQQVGAQVQQPIAAGAWFCSGCGASNAGGNFCQNCGTRRK